jgi:ABC-2 type transport system permease protein
MVPGLKLAGKAFRIVWITDPADGLRQLKLKKIDAWLENAQAPDKFGLWVLKKESVQTLAILAGLSALQKSVEGGRPGWVSAVHSLQAGGLQRQALPTWIMMLVLLVGFIILPVQVAEEKEKKLVLGLLQTPMREYEWLLAKLLLGIILMLAAALLLQGLDGFIFGKSLNYFVLLGVGSFCFSALGILLGCLCKTQASARTLGVVFYLPFLLPSAFSDFSEKLNRISAFLPSYWFFEPLKTLLLETGPLVGFSWNLGYLLSLGLATFFLSWLLIKKRWLM